MKMEESFRKFDGKTKHCYFVISKIDSDGNVLVVNCSTYHGLRSQDSTCILNVGDHPFIDRTSFIPYNFAAIMKYSDVLKLHPVMDVSPELYDRLRDGVKKSDRVSSKILNYILSH